MHSHTGCICSTFPHDKFSNEPLKSLPERMQSHIGCICSTFLHCGFSNVPSNCLLGKTHNHTGCICLTFLHYASSNVSSTCLPEWMQSHTGCICLTFPHCVFSNVSSNCLPEKMHYHTGCICLIFPFAHGQLFHWNSSAWNYHAQGFVPLPTSGKVCLLLLTVLNWENSNCLRERMQSHTGCICLTFLHYALRKFRCKIATKKKKMKGKVL